MSKIGQERNPGAELLEDLAAGHLEVNNPESPSAAAKQADDELWRFFALSLDLLCIAGFDGYFKRLNPAWTTRLGWTQKELEARPFLDFVHPDDRETTLAEIENLAEGADTTLFENRYRHQDGSYRWLQWNARAVPGSQRIYATARDITRQKRLEREVLEIADREKERLGQELHDGLCQTLAGIAALSSTLSRKSATTSASAASAEITQLLNETIDQARDLARGLGPIGLDEAGLQGALEALSLNVHHMFRVTCALECDHHFPRLGHEAELHLFRIGQEAVNNAVAHGQAESIGISLSTRDGGGLLSVRDDGVGLPETTGESDGIGMHTMAYRARLLGGTLEVRQRSRGGTEVTCTFPLPDSSTEH